MESDPELLASLSRTWYKDGVPLTGLTGPSQVLGELSPSDSGTYKCMVATSVDSATVEHTLSVFRRTRLLQGPAPSPRMVSGNALKLDCEVEVDPGLRRSLSVVWGRGEEELGEGVEEWGADSTLTTTWQTTAEVEDSGDYWCATTTRLEDRQVGEVAKVEVLPASFTSLSDGLETEVVAGDRVALQCGARPSPALALKEIAWYRDGQRLPVARLPITKLTQSVLKL